MWVPTASEGKYKVQVVVKDFSDGSTAMKTMQFTVTPLVTGNTPVVTATQSWARPPAARDGFAISGPFPAALEAPPAGYAGVAVPEAYRDPAFMPLGAPAYGSGLPPALPALTVRHRAGGAGRVGAAASV